MRTIPSAHLVPGDTGRLWRHYDDHVRVVRLAAQPAGDRVVMRSAGVERAVGPPGALAGSPAWSFFPPALAGGLRDIEVVEAVKTGGRTFRLTPSALATLGLPIHTYLDLPRLGWGRARVAVDVEVKGAGSDTDQVCLDEADLTRVLDGHPALASSWARASSDPSAVMASLATYLGRNRGGQSRAAAKAAVVSSEAMLRQASLKIAPSWMAVAQSEEAHEHLRIVSAAARQADPLYGGTVANELRLTPGSVRAAYFDTAASDAELRRWARRVATDPQDLATCSDEMVEDVRRHLELLALSTVPSASGISCRWTKVGDVHLMFQPGTNRRYDDADEYRHKRTAAWFLAKDEVVVGAAGKFFVDMESLWPDEHGFVSLLGADLALHHELAVLTVLRDHVRVCTQFDVARRLCERDEVGPEERLSIQRATVARIVAAVDRSAVVALDLDDERAVVTLRYPALASIEAVYRLDRGWLAERY
jgi:hypothetical protein